MIGSILLLTVLCAAAALAGYAFGLADNPKLDDGGLAGSLVHLDDSTLARVAYEAQRAARQAEGDFTAKAWNNITSEARTSAVRAVEAGRSGEGIRLGGVFGAVAALG